MADDFRPMQPITLGVPVTEERTAFYPSLILDFTSGSSLLVGVPLDQGAEVRLRPNADVTMDVSLASGIVRYRTRVRGRTDNPPAVQLDWPTGSERIQRREHFRVTIQVPVQGTAVIGTERRSVRGATMDMSAGGMRVRLGEALPAGTRVELQVALPSTAAALSCRGRVVRSGDVEAATGAERYWNGVEFMDMPESARKEITRFVFEVQREQMRKGLL